MGHSVWKEREPENSVWVSHLDNLSADRNTWVFKHYPFQDP